MAGRGCRNHERVSIRRIQLAAFPGGKAHGIAAKPAGRGRGGEYAAGLGKKGTAGDVEIVGVLVVAEEHRVDGAGLLSEHRGPCGLFQRHMRELIIAGIIECRVGEKAQASKLNERCRAADQGD